MVTRHSIDRILSCSSNEEHPYDVPISPSRSLSTPPSAVSSDTRTTPVTPSSPKIFTAFKDALDLSQGSKALFDEHPEDMFNSPRPYEGRVNTKDDISFSRRERSSPSPFDPSRHILARPVPLRPTASRSNGPPLERPPLNSAATPAANGLCNGLGYNLPNGMTSENNFYTMMFRHYVETQLRGMANSRSYAPLGYALLDPAFPHMVGGANLPYPLTNRSRRRGGQVRFTGDQTRQLESWFHLHKYINPSQRKTIARELNLQERQVKTWFQNRRAKWRKLEAQPSVDGHPTDIRDDLEELVSDDDDIQEAENMYANDGEQLSQ
ncbi:hypothetical protein SK128_011983 [Halocaridina rubra]|uniref:Homeobox domain-containing protein n=1 Tax=Halocaridina rubra TaxID=373956 RepID=A0AAN8X9B6_HALRR